MISQLLNILYVKVFVRKREVLENKTYFTS